MSLDGYLPIADHGLVGDLQCSALVSAKGVVDWFAAPRFDSPSIFAALLDHDGGGYFRLAPSGPKGRLEAALLPGHGGARDPVHVTRRGGRGPRLDAARPLRDRFRTAPARPCRADGTGNDGVRPGVPSALRLRAGRPRTHRRSRRRAFRPPGITAFLRSTFPLERDGQGRPRSVTLNAGETAAAVFTVDGPDAPAPPPPTVPETEENRRGPSTTGRTGSRNSKYRGRWPDMVHRSAITLKLLTYAPTGAPVAAATMGLPEQIGGERNWDYRYTWVRDGSLSLRALIDLGFPRRRRRSRTGCANGWWNAWSQEGEALQIMYRVDGTPLLGEEILEHFEGYRGSSPVRVGNAASDQLQLDIYGEALYGISEGRELVVQADYAGMEGRLPRPGLARRQPGTAPTRASGRPAADARTSSSPACSAGSAWTVPPGSPCSGACPPTSTTGAPCATASMRRSTSGDFREKPARHRRYSM